MGKYNAGLRGDERRRKSVGSVAIGGSFRKMKR